jgi:hypothetical protein
MAEDIYVFEDQGWYGLVALDGGYLLVYFLLGYDVTVGSCEGYSVGCLSVPDVFFLTKKLYSSELTSSRREEKIKCPKGILPSGRPLHAKVGDGGWMGKLAPGLGRVDG